jgi:hypothetical protein
MLVMILWWQRMPSNRRSFFTTVRASIDARSHSSAPWLVDFIELRSVILR